MKLLVAFKRVPDPAAGSLSPAAADSSWIINPFDAIAIEEAVRIKERGEATEIVGVTIGPGETEEQIRAALAMGLDRAVRVGDERALDPFAVARILAAVVRRENPRLVLMGKQAIDDDANQVGQMLAGLLGWPQATFISKLDFLNHGQQARCTRETDRGLEILEMDLPAIVTTDLRLNEPRYVSLPGLIKARRRPIESCTLPELGVNVQSRTTVISLEPAQKRQAGKRVANVEELVNCLRHQEKLL